MIAAHRATRHLVLGLQYSYLKAAEKLKSQNSVTQLKHMEETPRFDTYVYYSGGGFTSFRFHVKLKNLSSIFSLYTEASKLSYVIKVIFNKVFESTTATIVLDHEHMNTFFGKIRQISKTKNILFHLLLVMRIQNSI